MEIIKYLTLGLLGVQPKSIYEGYSEGHETVFVLELIRHGSRSHYLDSPIPKDFFGEGVEPGFLTEGGRLQHLRNGFNRRSEYIHGKQFLSSTFSPDEVLSLSTFKQRCAVSGEFFLKGLYPLEETAYSKDMLSAHLDP